MLRAPDDDGDEFWLCKAVRQDAWAGKCAMEYKGKEHAKLGPAGNKSRYDNGDFQVALQVTAPPSSQ